MATNTARRKNRATPGTRAKTPARSEIEQSIRMKLRIIFSSAKKQSREIEARFGVSGAQFWVLAELDKQRGLRVSDLAKLICIHNSTASNLLDKLEQRRLIYRERADRDQRVVRLYLTPDGAAIVAQAHHLSRSVVADALGNVSADTLQALDRNLEALVAHLKIRDTSAVFTPLSDI